MRFLIDENMSRKWVRELRARGHKAEHWLEVGRRGAADKEIMSHARASQAIVLTCDLDFADILAASGAKSPSVLQLRPGKVRPDKLIASVLAAIGKYKHLLKEGALLSIDLKKSRARALPLTYK
jgi:predicted nuclease of predicted toxin-antitoxin system